MKVSVDVYTKDVDAALAAFKVAVESRATDVRLTSSEDWNTKAFLCLNLVFDPDHRSVAISNLDDGPFVKSTDDL